MRPFRFHMTGLTHASQVTDGICLFRVGELPEWNYMVNRDGRSDVLETYNARATITQDGQRTSLYPTPSTVRFYTANIEAGQNPTPSFRNEFVGTHPVAEPPHLIPAGMLARFTWRSLKILRAIRACVLNVFDKSPALSRSNLSFIGTRKSEAMLVAYRMGPIVNTVSRGPFTMTRLAAKTRRGQTVVRYRILDSALNAVLDWHVTKIANKRYHGGSMSIAIACDIEGFDLTLCEIDKDYFESGSKRLKYHQSAPRLFDVTKPEPAEQISLYK